MKTATATLLAMITMAAICLADGPESGPRLDPVNIAPKDDFLNSDTITLLSVDVDLTPSPQQNKVTAVFCLENNDAHSETQLDVGFPSYNYVPMKDFSLEIDGKSEKAEVRKIDGVTYKIGDRERKGRDLYWMCWPMKFSAGQKRTVKVSYWVQPVAEWRVLKPEKGNRTYAALEQPPDPKQLPANLAEKLGGYKSGYVLSTGTGWQGGEKGKATIRIHYGPDCRKEQITWLYPDKGWTYDKQADTDTIVLGEYKTEIIYSWGMPDQVKLLREAMENKQLGVEAQRYLLRLLGWEQFDQKPGREALDAMACMVAPVGATFDPSQTEPYLSARLYQAVYQNVFEHYKSSGQADKAGAAAGQYGLFLKAVTEKWQEKMKGVKEGSRVADMGEGYRVNVKELKKQIDAAETQRSGVEEFLKGNAGKKESNGK
ncbi:MAG: hypothetical protein HZA50_16075 [Planctomycetes bacterium]|nr:hypothetical protein [Planctomycetota bacterium]